eukprot:1277719-Rhodomonas_salina.3
MGHCRVVWCGRRYQKDCFVAWSTAVYIRLGAVAAHAESADSVPLVVRSQLVDLVDVAGSSAMRDVGTGQRVAPASADSGHRIAST